MSRVTGDVELIEVSALRLGHYVELDVGWLDHPFPTGSFKLSTVRQIDTIRSLGLQRVRVNQGKSDPEPAPAEPEPTRLVPATPQELTPAQRQAEERRLRAEQLAAQQRSLLVCERRFNDAVRLYRRTLDLLPTQPQDAQTLCHNMVRGFVDEMMGVGESAIRLLSETAGDKAAMHPVNVTVVSLLLGKALGLRGSELVDLGLAAFLHDVGKTQLPERVRWFEEGFSTAEYRLYQDHVAKGLPLLRAMGLEKSVLLAMAQHHEMVDGSGFPARIRGDAMSREARILALVNRYDNLCNPFRTAAALTPHEALSLIFAQQKARFDSVTLSAFIRMMGVYPPGSVVQLIDERYAMVMSVNSARPLKPRVLVYEPGMARDEALMLDLERNPSIGIRRSLKPAALPSAAGEFLAPRQRVSYFFEQAADSQPGALT